MYLKKLPWLFLVRSQAVQDLQAPMQTWPGPRTTPRTNSPQNGTETASRNQGYESLKVVDPKFLRIMHFAKKYNKKGRKKMPTTPRPQVQVLRLSRPS